MAANLELAIGLVQQAIDQDTKTNYEEAARCYREALVTFRKASRQLGVSAAVKAIIDGKCAQYESRLKMLDRYLLQTADLSPIFKGCLPVKRADTADLLSRGLEAIDRGRRKDQRRQLDEAVKCYETGLAILMELGQKGGDSVDNEHLRFKCLLIHERVENIRNHLESGLPISAVNNSLDYSNGSEAGSPEPFYPEEEVEAKLMDAASVLTSSHHSLYPHCEVNVRSGDNCKSIPLANLAGELQLSSSSLASSSGPSDASFEANMNVTEVAFANSGLDLDSQRSQSLGSDSGILVGSPSKNSNSTDIGEAKLPAGMGDVATSVDINSNVQEASSVGSEAGPSVSGSIKAVASMCGSETSLLDKEAAGDEREKFGREADNASGSILLVHRSVDGTPSPSFSGGKTLTLPRSPKAKPLPVVRKDLEDEVTVLSREDVVDGAVAAKNNRSEYIPPRALASLDDDDEDNINKGCYYFLACLDTLWIL